MSLKESVAKAFVEQQYKDEDRAGDSDIDSLVSNVSAALDTVSLSDFPKLSAGRVIEIPSDATIAQVVQTLSENNILSAPVVQNGAQEGATWQDRYLGLVDFAGIVLWVLKEAEVMAAAITASAAGAGGLAAGVAGTIGAVALGVASLGVLAGVAAGAATAGFLAGGMVAGRTAGKSGTAAAEALGDDFFKLLHESEVYQKTMVSEVAAAYLWSTFQPMETSDSLYALLVLLSEFELKRVPIIDNKTGQAVNYITQSAVLRWLNECGGARWFDAIADRKLEDLALPIMTSLGVLSVSLKTPILNALQLMQQYKISGVPVLQENKIVGNVSIRDVRFLLASPDLFEHGREPTVSDLIEKAQLATGESEGEQSGPTMRPAVTCTMGVTLKEVISLLVEKQIHRVYVTDSEQQVLGVITPQDIISRFISLPGAEPEIGIIAEEATAITEAAQLL